MQRWWDGAAWGAYAPVVAVTPARPSEGLAVLAFVLGLVAFLIGWVWVIAWLPAGIAIFTGIFALRAVRTNGKRGAGLASVGIVLGGLAILFALGVFVSNALN